MDHSSFWDANISAALKKYLLHFITPGCSLQYLQQQSAIWPYPNTAVNLSIIQKSSDQ